MSLIIMTISKNLNKFIWIILLSLMANVTIADEELSLTSSDKDLLQAIQREILYLESEKLTLTNEKNRLIKSYLKAKNEVEESISELEKKLNDQNLKNKEKELVVKNLEEQSENFSDEKNTLESINNQIEEQLSLLGLKSSNNLIQNIEVIQKNLKSNSKIKIVTRDFYNDLGEKQQSSVLQVGQVLFWGQIMDQWKPLKFIEDNKLTTISNQESNEISFNTENKINNTAIQGVIIDKVTKIENEAIEKSIIDTIGSGGAIGWLIVSLGGLAFIFSIIRFIFLNKSSKESIMVVNNEHSIENLSNEELSIHAKLQNPIIKKLYEKLIIATPEQWDEITSEFILSRYQNLDRWSIILIVIATISPLLGLLGTVTGMISTFDIITAMGSGDPKSLSGGISEALITTELGLIVAIPTLVASNLLSGWSKRIKSNIEQNSLALISSLKSKAL